MDTAAGLVIVISSFTGFLIKIYFTYRFEEGAHQKSVFYWFCSLPFLIILLGLLADRMIFTLYDSLDQPPLARSVSLILTSPGVRRSYHNTGIEMVYIDFVKWIYLPQLEHGKGLFSPSTKNLKLQSIR